MEQETRNKVQVTRNKELEIWLSINYRLQTQLISSSIAINIHLRTPF